MLFSILWCALEGTRRPERLWRNQNLCLCLLHMKWNEFSKASINFGNLEELKLSYQKEDYIVNK